MKPALAWLAAAFALLAAPALAQNLTLTGRLTGADHQTYREIPFKAPAGLTAITVTFAYTGKDQKSVIDLGLRDPQRFRGWSGGNKQVFTLTETWATPSYLPGPLPAGTWKLILGVPNLRKGARADYKATVSFARGGAFAGFAAAPLKTGPGWYRGDLHLHTGHSDGTCSAQSGARVPCPVFRTLEAAAARGLDFVAVTDHNTTSHFQPLAELQPYFDRLLLIPAREITTFQGHANVFGATAPLDFQLGSGRAPDFARILHETEAAGGLIAINHPGLPSGEVCMGCGWTATLDFRRVAAIEVLNGAFPSLPFWEARLNEGLRVTAIGGSDNHDPSIDPMKAPAVGVPTTVVHAGALSQPAILEAVRAGHVFIDAQGTRERRLEVTARSGGKIAEMGDSLAAPAGASVTFTIRVAHAAGGGLGLVGDGPKPKLSDATLVGDDEIRTFTLASDGRPHWLRVDVRGPDGRLWLIGNPIYLNAAH